MTRATAKQIIDFWVNDVGPKGWYEADTAVDRQIIERFGTAYDARSFAADPLARDIARGAIAMDLDLEIKGGEQQFFYLPFAHSEDMADQDFGVECVQTRKFQNDDDALHARAHREIIRTFGRFPFRNQVLNRDSSDAEQEFMFDGGYGNIVRKLQAP